MLLSLAENTDINRLDAVVEEEKNKRVLTPTPQSNLAWQTCRKLIYVPRSAQKGYSVGHWPIPESFWPDLNSPMLVSFVNLLTISDTWVVRWSLCEMCIFRCIFRRCLVTEEQIVKLSGKLYFPVLEAGNRLLMFSTSDEPQYGVVS